MTANKQSLRSTYKEWRSTLTSSFITQSELAVTAQLEIYFSTKRPVALAAYYPTQHELSSLSYLRSHIGPLAFPRSGPTSTGYELATIRSISSDFILGPLNIYQPKASCPRIEPNDIDYWLVPGLAFDRQGNRLGFGSGIYDRLLNQSTGISIGLAYDEQVCPSLPVDAHDQKMSVIITPSQIIHL